MSYNAWFWCIAGLLGVVALLVQVTRKASGSPDQDPSTAWPVRILIFLIVFAMVLFVMNEVIYVATGRYVHVGLLGL